ncbi:hypothetical protein NYE80_25480 [Paenibacillus sp. FSL H7-0357]|uniref:hypothetical protein n=1 Tax=Paenibacillus sp. FSL H7-0357 TaxID=1536774 RepID=UPI0030D42BD5
MMIGADVLQISPLPYYMPSKTILLTLSAFVLMFLVISVFCLLLAGHILNIRFLWHTEVLDL